MDNTIHKPDEVRMFQNLLGNLPGMVYRCKYNKAYTMLYVSEGCEKLTGWKAENILHDKKLTYEDLIYEDDRQSVCDTVDKAVLSKKHFELTYRIKTRSGQIRWVWEKGNGVCNKSTGEIEFLEGFITDITREKEDSQRLAEREHQLSEILSTVDMGIIFAEINGRVLSVNKAFTSLTGISADQVIGKKVTYLARKFIKPSQLPDILPLIIKAFNGNEVPVSTVNINNRILQISSNLSTNNNITTFITDITQQKAFEDQIVQAKIKAEESDRLKSTFLANMSHEIRTPMNGIVGFTELLRDPELDESDKQRYIDIIHVNSEQLLNIINDILDISRIEAGRLGIFPSKFEPFVLLKHLTETAQILVKHKPISIRFKYDLPLGVKIETDMNRLQQILFNLVANAVKFTNEGFIEIGCHRINIDSIEFFVKDSGIGIKKEAGQKIFERFRQVDEGDTRTYGGTGLGLSISKSLVNLLGGKIGYVTTPGKGSQFYFTIPDKLKSLK